MATRSSGGGQTPWRALHTPRGAQIACIAALLALTSLTLWPASARGDDFAAKVYLNGVPHPVYFNDGDSFRVLAGEYVGYKARLAGFNTLESHGPVHQWGDWTAKELYVIAKMATLHARNGVWNCESDLSTDAYGRTLWWCEDLAVSQVRNGYAHAMSVKGPARPEVIAAQEEAIANRRGMWAHGVPDYVLTSTHSATEGGGADGLTYNRLVSSVDGHSEKWRHTDIYSECETVCAMTADVSKADLAGALAQLKSEQSIQEIVSAYDDDQLTEFLARFYYMGVTGYMAEKDHEVALTEVLEGYLEDGAFGTYEPEPMSCGIYVDFRRRYGGGKAECLRK